MRRRKPWALVVGIGILAAEGWYWTEHRHAALLDPLNPAYWVRRMRGEDLYDPQFDRLIHGNRSLKEVALTIDDGPHTPTGDQLLDILKRENVRATFFI